MGDGKVGTAGRTPVTLDDFGGFGGSDGGAGGGW